MFVDTCLLLAWRHFSEVTLVKIKSILSTCQNHLCSSEGKLQIFRQLCIVIMLLCLNCHPSARLSELQFVHVQFLYACGKDRSAQEWGSCSTPLQSSLSATMSPKSEGWTDIWVCTKCYSDSVLLLTAKVWAAWEWPGMATREWFWLLLMLRDSLNFCCRFVTIHGFQLQKRTWFYGNRPEFTGKL